MNINSIKNVKPGTQFPKKFLAVFLSIIIIAGSFIALRYASKDARDTIDVVRVKSKDGIPAKTLIAGDMLEKYAIIRKEYTNDMITYDRVNEAKNKYSLYFLRGKSFVYKDQITDKKPLKNEWLYELDKANEVLTMPYNYINCGGDILTPGDLVRVRVSYEAATGGGDPRDGMGGGGTYQRTDTLFDSIKVKDLLNSRGHSIYEVYKETLKLSEEKKQTTMKSREFLDSILPKSLVLEVTAPQAESYTRFSNMKTAQISITILSRQDNKNIIDQLPTISEEVESWTQQGN